jgi:hypothetical protein
LCLTGYLGIIKMCFYELVKYFCKINFCGRNFIMVNSYLNVFFLYQTFVGIFNIRGVKRDAPKIN